MRLLAEEAVELNYDGGCLGQSMRILCGHIESDEGSRTVCLSGCRDIPIVGMGFQTKTHVIPLAAHNPDRRSDDLGDPREIAQKCMASAQDGLLVSHALCDSSTPF